MPPDVRTQLRACTGDRATVQVVERLAPVESNALTFARAFSLRPSLLGQGVLEVDEVVAHLRWRRGNRLGLQNNLLPLYPLKTTCSADDHGITREDQFSVGSGGAGQDCFSCVGAVVLECTSGGGLYATARRLGRGDPHSIEGPGVSEDTSLLVPLTNVYDADTAVLVRSGPVPWAFFDDLALEGVEERPGVGLLGGSARQCDRADKDAYSDSRHGHTP